MEKISVAVEAAGYRGYLSEAKIICFAEYKRSGRGCIEEKNEMPAKLAKVQKCGSVEMWRCGETL